MAYGDNSLNDLDSEIIGAARPFCIAIDYDETFTACRRTWTRVIEVLREAGAKVICVTARYPHMTITDFPGEVIYTSAQPKWQAAFDAGHDVKVWIDDWPALIGENPDA